MYRVTRCSITAAGTWPSAWLWPEIFLKELHMKISLPACWSCHSGMWHIFTLILENRNLQRDTLMCLKTWPKRSESSFNHRNFQILSESFPNILLSLKVSEHNLGHCWFICFCSLNVSFCSTLSWSQPDQWSICTAPSLKRSSGDQTGSTQLIFSDGHLSDRYGSNQNNSAPPPRSLIDSHHVAHSWSCIWYPCCWFP